MGDKKPVLDSSALLRERFSCTAKRLEIEHQGRMMMRRRRMADCKMAEDVGETPLE